MFPRQILVVRRNNSTNKREAESVITLRILHTLSSCTETSQSCRREMPKVTGCQWCRQAGHFWRIEDLGIGNHVTGKRVHAEEEQETGCFEGNRGRKLRGRETRGGEEEKKSRWGKR